MYQGLIKQQVVCNDLEILKYMYPTFKIVKYENEIETGRPFIYVGDIKYINKIATREEPYIIVSFTGIYDLDKREVLLYLAYDKNNNTKKKTVIPKAIAEAISKWNDTKFKYNWKLLWSVGYFDDKVAENDKRFYEIIEHFSEPLTVIRSILRKKDFITNRFYESSMITYMNNSMYYESNKGQKYASIKMKSYFKNAFGKNVPFATKNILESKIDNDALRLLSLSLDIMMGTRYE